jgi:hypothetical protein
MSITRHGISVGPGTSLETKGGENAPVFEVQNVDGVFVFRPGITASRGGKIMAFLVLFILPILCLGAGFSAKLEASKSTGFCLTATS